MLLKSKKPYSNWLTSLVLSELLADNALRNEVKQLDAVRPLNPLVVCSNHTQPTNKF